MSIKAVEPAMGYELGISDGEASQAKLRFPGVTAPHPLRKDGSPFGGSNHFEQFRQVQERLDHTGAVLMPLDKEAVRALVPVPLKQLGGGPPTSSAPARSAA